MGKNLIIGLCFFLLSVWAIPVYGQTCDSDADCTGGLVCRTGPPPKECVQCNFQDDCQPGLFCWNHQCVPPECTVHCDCPQGQLCYRGKCLEDPNQAIYCCEKPGCPPGRWCFESLGGKGTCDEDPNYECQSPCDCGPAHACLYIQDGGGKRCIKDVDDPWLPGGTALFGTTIPPGEPTYCCSDPTCHAARMAYGTNISNFNCYDPDQQTASNFCGGTPCFYSGDCKPGESCIDTNITSISTKLPLGAICNSKGGHCVSHATLEVAYGYSIADLIPVCSDGCLPGMKCELGWKPGGVYLFQRVVGVCDSCGNGGCDPWEDYLTCSKDCQADICGDGICKGLETPKNCPQDCKQPVCGDGSCDASEVTGCPQDCGCPNSPNLFDYLSFCGDGYCDPNPNSLENCFTCPIDCGANCPQPVALCQNVTVNADSTCTASASINNGSYIPDGSPITLTQSPAGPYLKGNTSVTLMVTNIQGASSKCTGIVTVVDNTPPSIIAPAAVTAYTGPGSTSCGAVVNDETLGTAIGSDNCPGVISITRTGVPSGNLFPVGTTTITYTATDPAGNTSTATQTVVVKDTTPPVIESLTASPNVLWPPNHKMARVTVNASASDNCGRKLVCRITSVSSNEPENGLGDGDTAPDWKVTGNLTADLRAERSGNGSGRVYTLTITCNDAAENLASKWVTVKVPHDQEKK